MKTLGKIKFFHVLLKNEWFLFERKKRDQKIPYYIIFKIS